MGMAEGGMNSARKNAPGRLPVGGEGRLLKGCITFQLLLEGQILNKTTAKTVNKGLKKNSR